MLSPRLSIQVMVNNPRLGYQSSVVLPDNTPELIAMSYCMPLKILWDLYPCRYTVLRPRFSTQVLGNDARLGYQSSAVLPNNSPVRIAQGQIQRTRALAQASASLEACKQLHQVCLSCDSKYLSSQSDLCKTTFIREQEED